MAKQQEQDEQGQPATVTARATNQGTSPAGVNTALPDGTFAGTIILQPGESQIITTTEAEMAGASGDILFETGDDLQKAVEKEREEKEAEEAKVKEKKEARKAARAEGKKSPADELPTEDQINEMSDDELRDYLEQADGRKRPSNTSRMTLLDQALETIR